MKNRQNPTHDVVSCKTDKQKIDSSCNGVALFSPEIASQQNTDDSLNEQFQCVNFELQEANHKLHSKVAELDIITDYLKNILENIAQGILFIDLNGLITTCNRSAETILGIKSREVIFHSFWEIFKDNAFGFSMHTTLSSPIATHFPLQPEDEISGQQEALTYFTSYSSPLKRQCELEVVTTFALKNGKGSEFQNQGMILMIRDVTEMRHLQIMAARADRLKILGEMAAQVAHEIRNPLGGIKGFASLLKRDLKGNPDLQKMASYIVEGTDNLNNLVSQILHYARPVQLHFENTDLLILLQEVTQHILADTNIDKSEIVIELDCPFEKVPLSVDSGYFKSAVLNLIVNAIQAMPNGGALCICVRKNSEHVILSISDTGSGITEENIPKLYSPFFTTKPEGNGLGLAEVQKVIQAHGGTIDVTSVLDKGTTFTIKLPLSHPLFANTPSD